jgi:hypothetical protein
MATTYSRSYSFGFLFVGEMKRMVYETSIDPRDEFFAFLTEITSIILETSGRFERV